MTEAGSAEGASSPTLREAEAALCALLRGLRKRDWRIEVSESAFEIDADAFMPDDEFTVSVNLDDDSGVGRRLLREDRSNSGFGMARLERPMLAKARELSGTVPDFVWDRDPHDFHASLRYTTRLSNKKLYRRSATLLAIASRYLPG